MTRTVLITGASAGIGAACAREAARRGHDVIVHYHTGQARAEAVAEEVRAAGRRALVVGADVADPDAVAALFARIPPEAALDLVNNAGIVADSAPIAGLDHARLRRIFDVNVIGAILVAQGAVAHMRGNGRGGAIVNVSSRAATLGSANRYIDYAASKGALDTFTLGLADELAAEGIRVNAVRPGWIDTAIHAPAQKRELDERLAGLIPMGRTGSPEEVAEAILWLLSDQASYVTRTIMDVAGGN